MSFAAAKALYCSVRQWHACNERLEAGIFFLQKEKKTLERERQGPNESETRNGTPSVPTHQIIKDCMGGPRTRTFGLIN
jgi:hypothetical protein